MIELNGRVRRLWLAFSIILLFAVSGCGGRAEQTIALQRDGAWAIDFTYEGSAAQMEMQGFGAADIEYELEAMQEDLESLGGQMSWDVKRNGQQLRATVEASGPDVDTLDEMLWQVGLSAEAVTVDEAEAIRVSGYWLGDTLLDGGTLEVRGRDILDVEGGDARSGAVTYTYSDYVDVTLTGGGGGLSLGRIIGGLLLLGGIGVGGFVYVQWSRGRSRNCPSCAAAITRDDALFCPECGARLA